MNPKLRKFIEFCKDFSSNKVALVAFFIFLLILFVAIFAPLVSPTDPYDLNTVSIMNSRLPPFSEDFSGNYFLLGTDGAGRDMVSAIFYGLTGKFRSWRSFRYFCINNRFIFWNFCSFFWR